jgi:hypothetical protein
MKKEKPLYGTPRWDNIFLMNYEGHSYYVTIGSPYNGESRGLYGCYIHRHSKGRKYMAGVLPITERAYDFRDFKKSNLPLKMKDWADPNTGVMARHTVREINKYFDAYKKAYPKAIRAINSFQSSPGYFQHLIDKYNLQK